MLYNTDYEFSILDYLFHKTLFHSKNANNDS